MNEKSTIEDEIKTKEKELADLYLKRTTPTPGWYYKEGSSTCTLIRVRKDNDKSNHIYLSTSSPIEIDMYKVENSSTAWSDYKPISKDKALAVYNEISKRINNTIANELTSV